jgi:hypothetical protein
MSPQDLKKKYNESLYLRQSGYEYDCGVPK